MSDFDAQGYFDRRYGTVADANTKINALEAAKQTKLSAMEGFRQARDASIAANKNSLVSTLGLDPDSGLGTAVNFGASIADGALRVAGQVGMALPTVEVGVSNARIPNAVREAKSRMDAGTATDEDIALLNAPAASPVSTTNLLDKLVNERRDPKARTNLEELKDVEQRSNTVNDVTKLMDSSWLVHKGAQDVLTEDIKTSAKPGLDQVKQGYEAFKRTDNDLQAGMGDMAIGLAKALSTIPAAAISNPKASLEFITNNLPQIAMAALGPAGMAATNIPYAIDAFREGVQEYQKSHNGDMPPQEWMQENAIKAASLAAMETVGDKLTLGAGKSLKAITAPAKKAADEFVEGMSRGGIKTALQAVGAISAPVVRTAAALAEGGLGEFVTESYQTGMEENIKGKEASLEDMFVGGAIGAIAGGGTSGGIQVGKETAVGAGTALIKAATKGSTPGAREIESPLTPEKQTQFDEAKVSGDATVYADPESEDYSPKRALEVLFKHNQAETTTPEQKETNLATAQEVVAGLESTVVSLKESSKDIKISAEELTDLTETKAVVTQALENADPADTARVEQLTAAVAQLQGTIDSADRSTLPMRKAELGMRERELGKAQRVLKAITAQAARAPVAESSDPVVAATNTIKRSMTSPDQLTPEAASQLADDSSVDLSENQRAYLRKFSAARLANNALMSRDKVLQALMAGDGTGKNLSIADYQSKIGGAIATKNKDQAGKYVGLLSAFTRDHKNKAALAAELYAKHLDTGEEFQMVSDGNGNWSEPATWLSKKELTDNGGLKIYGASKNIVADMATGASALAANLAQQEAAYDLTFGGKPAAQAVSPTVKQVIEKAKQTAAPQTKETKKEEPKAQKSQLPRQQVGPNKDSFSNQNAQTDRDTADRLGLTAIIEQEFSTGKVAKQVVTALDSQMQMIPMEDRTGFIVNVRATLGIPSQMSDDGKSEFPAWKAEYDKRSATAKQEPKAAKASETPTSEVVRGTTSQGVVDEDSEQDTQEEGSTAWTLANLEHDFPGVKYRELSSKESGQIKVAIEQLRPLLGDAIERIAHIFVQTGRKGSAATFYREYDAIAISEEVLTGALDPDVDASLEARILRLLAHELAHKRDFDRSDAEGRYLSETTGSLNVGGKVYKQVLELLSKADTPATLKKWFRHVFKDTLAPNRLPRELYAQLHALYVIQPELMNAYLPQAYQAVERDNGLHRKGMEKSQSVPVGRGSPEVGSQPTEARSEPTKDSGVRLPDLEAEVQATEAEIPVEVVDDIEPGFLTNFTKEAVAAEKAKTDYQQINLLTRFFKQAAGKASSITYRPLAAVKDFLTQWAAGNVTALDVLTPEGLEQQALSTEQDTALNTFRTQAMKWLPMITANLSGKTPQEFAYQDLMQFFINESGDIEENVKAAIAVAAYQYVAELAGGDAYNTDKAVNSLINKPSTNTRFTEEQRELFKVGTGEHLVQNALGKSIMGALGISSKPDAPQNVQAQMESALGAHAVKLLIDAKLLTVTTYDGVAWKRITGNEKVKDKALIHFVGLTRDEKFKPSTEAAAILDSLKGTQDVLGRMFGVESRSPEPSFEPVPYVQSAPNNSQQAVPAELAKVLKKENSTANRLKQASWRVVEQMSKENMLTILGAQDVHEESVHVDNEFSVLSKNAGLERGYESLMDFVKNTLSGSVDGLKQAMYLSHEVWKNQRVGINGIINPQADKFHRGMLTKDSWESVVHLDNDAEMQSFILRVGEGLGVKTENSGVEAAVLKSMDTMSKPAIKAAVAAMRKENLTEEDQQAIVAGVAAGGEKMHSFDVLMAMAQYEDAVAKGETSFTTSLAGEIDGKTNGPMLSFLLLGAANTAQDLMAWLNKGGFYSGEDSNTQYGDWRAQPGNQDLYEGVSTALVENIRKDIAQQPKGGVDRYGPIFHFIGDLMANTEKSVKSGRDLVKTPITALFFGSSLNRGVESMADKFLENIYKAIETVAKNGGDPIETLAIIKNLNKLVPGWKIPESMGIIELMNTRIPMKRQQALRDAFKETLGDTIKATLDDQFHEFIAVRDSINKTGEIAYTAYNAAYQGLRKAYVDQLVKDGEIAQITKRNAKGETWQVPAHDLTKEQEATLRKKIAATVPVVETAMSQTSKNRAAGMLVGKSRNKQNNDPTYTGSAKFGNKFDKGGTAGGKAGFASSTTIGSSQATEGPGVGTLVSQIHSSDSAVSHRAAFLGEVLNVHDAHVTGLSWFQQTAQNLNKAVWDTALTYSPATAIRNTLLETLDGVADMLADPQTSEQVRESVLSGLASYAEKKSTKDNTVNPETLLRDAVMEAFDTAYFSDRVRLQVLSELGAIDQYPSHEGSYIPTDADRAEATKRLEALENVPSEALLKSVAAIEAALSGKPVTVTPTVAEEAAIVEQNQTEEPLNEVIEPIAFIKKKKRKQRVDPREAADDMPAQAQAAATYNTKDIFNALDSISPNPVSVGFAEHLANLLDKMVHKLHGPFGSFKESLMKDQVISPIDVYNKAVNTGKAPFASQSMAAGLGITEQEAFVIEQIEVTVQEALTGNAEGNMSYAARGLAKLYTEARRSLTAKDFFDGDWATATPAQQATAQAKHDFVFKVEASGGGLSNYLSRFAALGLAHEGINAMLKGKTLDAPKKNAPKSMADRLAGLFSDILEWFSEKMTRTYKGQPANSKLTTLVKQLVDIEGKRRNMLRQPAGTSILDQLSETTKDMTDKVNQAVVAMASSNFVQNSPNKIFKAGVNVARMVAEGRTEQLLEAMSAMRDKHASGQLGMVFGTIKDALGAPELFQRILRATKNLERARKHVSTQTSKVMLQAFANQGVGMGAKTKKALTNVILRTGAHVLLDHFNETELHRLLTVPGARDKAIQFWEGKINTFPAGVRKYYINQSRALGYSLVWGEARGPNMMLNALNIASLHTTSKKGLVTPAQVEDATKIIDVLTTLYALRYSDAYDLRLAGETLAAEMARTDNLGNGVTTMLYGHKALEKEARERLFDGSEALMVKGYTTEIFNPYIEVQAVEAAEGQELVDAGYSEGRPMAKDPQDPDNSVRRLYIRRGGGLAQHVTGIFSYTGKEAKGTAIHNGNLSLFSRPGRKNALNLANMQILKASAMDELFTQDYDPTTDLHKHAAPVLNPQGDVVNYRYMMGRELKDDLLERDNRFEVIMGGMAASSFDKQTATEQNTVAIGALYDLYQAEYASKPEAYLDVGPNSPDPELREIYRLLPFETKEAIRQVWKSDTMKVRNDLVDLSFGYRKLSLSKVWDKDDAARNHLEFAFTWFAEHAVELAARSRGKTPAQAKQYAKRTQFLVQKGERVWMDIVKEVKDIIVIKTGTVMIGNIVSNLTLLKLNGVSFADMGKHHKTATLGAKAWQRDSSELFRLQGELKSGYSTQTPAQLERQIRVLEDSMARNPVKTLIDAGLMPSIVEDVSVEDSPYTYKAQLARRVESMSAGLNPAVMGVAKGVYMSRDTALYKSMSEITQLSDFVARYTLYMHLTTKKNPVDHNTAIQKASDAFVNYDIPMHRNLQYLDDAGLMMFMKYFIRIQRVIAGLMKESPTRVIGMLMANHLVGIPDMVLDASMLNRIGNNPLSMGAFQYPFTLDDLATVNAGISLIK